MRDISKPPLTLAALGAAALFGAQSTLADPLVYVPLGSDNRIVTIDAANDQIVGHIEGVAAVHGLAGTPDGRFLIAGSYEERPLGGGAPAKPAGISADEHAAHHAPPAPSQTDSAEATVSTVSVIRTEGGTVVRAIDVPGAVHHVAVSPDGRYAVVTRPNEGEVSAIDLASYDIVADVATGSFPNYSVFSPDSGTLYVSNAGEDSVSVIDVGGWSVKTRIAVGSSPEHVVLTDDGGTLYVNNVEDGTVSVIDVASASVAKTIPVGSTLHGIDLSADGTLLYVASLGDDAVARIDVASGTVSTLKLSPAPYHLAAVTGTDKIYVSSSDDPKIWVIGTTGFEVVGEIAIGGKGHQMVTMPSN